jgi:anti-anti-sigma factor
VTVSELLPRIVQDPDGVAVIILEGEVDLATCDVIPQAVGDVLSGGATSVVIDLEQVTFMDSQGLRALLLGQLAVQEGGGTIVIRRPGRTVLAAMQVAGLDGILRIEP